MFDYNDILVGWSKNIEDIQYPLAYADWMEDNGEDTTTFKIGIYYFYKVSYDLNYGYYFTIQDIKKLGLKKAKICAFFTMLMLLKKNDQDIINCIFFGRDIRDRDIKLVSRNWRLFQCLKYYRKIKVAESGMSFANNLSALIFHLNESTFPVFGFKCWVSQMMKSMEADDVLSIIK